MPLLCRPARFDQESSKPQRNAPPVDLYSFIYFNTVWLDQCPFRHLDEKKSGIPPDSLSRYIDTCSFVRARTYLGALLLRPGDVQPALHELGLEEVAEEELVLGGCVGASPSRWTTPGLGPEGAKMPICF